MLRYLLLILPLLFGPYAAVASNSLLRPGAADATPTVTMQKGDAVGATEAACVDCHYIALSHENLPRATYDICVHFDAQGDGCWRTYRQTLEGSGVWQAPSYSGERTKGWVKLSNSKTGWSKQSATIDW